MKLLQFLTKRSTGTPRPSSSRRTRLQLEQLESRLVPYAVSGNAWPNPQLITLSFEPDGTIVGQNNSGNLISNLFSAFNTKFGSAATWQNVILKAAQTWAAQTNINFTVVSDNGGSIGSGSYEQGDPNMGDIRIGGYNFGSTTLASTYMPPSVNNYSIAGDMQFNTGQTWNIGSQYDLYTVSMHEIGHALGLYHSNIVSADMYQAYHGVMSTLASDDISGIRNIYSGNNARSADSYYSNSPSNNSFTNATSLTSLINGSTLTAQVTYLDITTSTEQEFFSVTAPTGTSGTFTVSAQSAGLSLLTPSLTVYAADQTTVLGTASVSGTNGGTATVTVGGVTAGTQYYLKVAGVDATVFSRGRYALTL